MDFLNIIVTGTGSSGKTTLINTVSEIPVMDLSESFRPKDVRQNVELGRVRISGDTFLYLIGTPPDDKYHIFWDRASNDLVGFIFVVGTSKDSVEETKKAIKTLEDVENVPFIVVANELQEKKDIDKMRKALGLKKDRDLVSVDLRDKEKVNKVLTALISSTLAKDTKKTA